MYVLFDIGGTKTRVSTSADLKTYCTPEKFDTPKDFNEGVAAIVKAAKHLCGDEPIEAAAGGIRGPLNKDHSRLLSEDVLVDWVDMPVLDTLKSGFGTENVFLENDAAIVGLGEAHYGSGKDYDILAYLTVSTGVGGCRIDHGEIDHASIGFEPGKQVVNLNGDMLEDLISGTALEKRRGVKPYEISQDDPIWKELARTLSFGVKNTIVYWSPDAVVLGGSMIIGDPRIFREDIACFTKVALEDLVPVPPILDAKLGDEGGLYGAMALLTQKQA